MAAHAERFARQFRQAFPGGAPVEWPTQRDAGLDALVEGCRARRIVTAEAYAPHADALGIEIASRFSTKSITAFTGTS